MTGRTQQSIRERLHDLEYRREFGAANIKYELAFALVEARKRLRLTQKELAYQAGVSQAYIAKLESGEANPTIGQIGALLATVWLKPKFEIQPLASSGNPAASELSRESASARCEDAVLKPYPSGAADSV